MSNDRTRILVVDDEEIVRESLGGWLEKDGYTIAVAPDGPSALEKLKAERWSILIVDLKMPGMDGLQVLEEAKKILPELAVVIMTAYATVDTAVAAMKAGAYDYLVKPFDPEELSIMMQKIVSQQTLVRENVVLRQALKQEYRFRDLLSKSPAMQSLFELAKTAARSNSTILVLGESGTGKEVLARAIHAESPRADQAFVAVSCAALTETLLESELFGHEKGSFTGATARRKGKFEAADGGTLFLDEVGDIGPKLQLDLLRVLEERKLREDLFYRLNVIPVVVPPLRQRREDIPLLVESFVERLAVEMKKRLDGVSAEAMSALMAHDWPGNVRELRNVLERGAVVATGTAIQLSDLGLPGRLEAPPKAGTLASLEEVEKRHVAAVLAHTGGNVSQSARILGIDRVTLYNKMRKYGLRRDGEADEPSHEPVGSTGR